MIEVEVGACRFDQLAHLVARLTEPDGRPEARLLENHLEQFWYRHHLMVRVVRAFRPLAINGGDHVFSGRVKIRAQSNQLGLDDLGQKAGVQFFGIFVWLGLEIGCNTVRNALIRRQLERLHLLMSLTDERQRSPPAECVSLWLHHDGLLC